MGAEFGPGAEEFEDEETGAQLREYNYVPVLDGKVLSSKNDDELKESLCEELGIDQAVLIEMNDGHSGRHIKRHSFTEIADYIEENL
jgi:hypothetical protein